jgi:1-acyl-sn-glycerol-3-phosphate acyltransferase
LRRLVLAPVAVVVAIAVAMLFPLLTVLMFVVSLAGLSWPRRMRGLRLLCFALTWLAADAAAVFMSQGLWLASGFGGRLNTEPYQARHYGIMHWFLDVVYQAAVRLFRLRIEVAGPEPAATGDATSPHPGEGATSPAPGEGATSPAPGGGATSQDRPVIVLSRHAGPGDSLLLVRYLLTECGRRPNVVMTAAMQFDPAVDVVANRLPNVFVRRRRTGTGQFVEQIERLAQRLESNGALVIFPEGGNWTPGRWQRRVRRLEQAGHDDLAARARAMPHLLPPRSGGALSAIAARPDADVIFVAHAGMDQLVSVGDVWRSLPMDHVVHAQWWRVPAEEVPRREDHDSQVRWLYDWWQRIETWVSGQQLMPMPAQPDPAPPEE